MAQDCLAALLPEAPHASIKIRSTYPPHGTIFMNPVVKWTGGKRSEIPFLKPHYPQGFTRVVEPFSGGAAVAWDLEGMPAVINDINGGLINFYRTLQDPKERDACKAALVAINERRLRLRSVVDSLTETHVRAFYADPAAWAAAHHADLAIPSSLAALDVRFEALVKKHGASKTGRIAKIESTRGEPFNLDELRAHLETALQSAWYEVMREIYNQQIPVDRAWQAAAWWAVRVLCYSGMFRFSSKGLFNVPYGGISYNARDFNASVEDLFGSARIKAWERFTVEQKDFDELMAAYHDFNADDFLFIDPPYDSTFSQYNVEGDFTASDQERLRDALNRSPAKWMVVIKRTKYIEQLYDTPGHHCYVFDKTYAVNFRNRHDRGVQHLVVTNYPLKLKPEREALRALADA